MNNQYSSSKLQNNYLVATNKGPILYIAAFLFASFIVFFPWELINRQGGVGGFNDFGVYLNYFEVDRAGRSKVDIYGFNTIIQFFTGEVIWDYLIGGLSTIVGSYAALRTASFFIVFIWCLVAFRYLPIWWAIIFLANPTSIDLAMSGIRNGLSFAVFLFGLYYLSGTKKTVTLFLTPFIHSTGAVLLIFYYGIKIWHKKIIKNSVVFFSERTRTIIIAIIPGILLGFALTVLNDLVLGFLGDRRIGVVEKSASPSILQSLFWYILFAVQLTCSTDYIKKHAFTLNVIAWYLVMNLSISWSYRIWGAMIPIIAISIWELPQERRRFIVLLWIGYLFLWYVYWTKFLLWIIG